MLPGSFRPLLPIIGLGAESELHRIVPGPYLGLQGWDEGGWDNPKIRVLVSEILNATYLHFEVSKPDLWLSQCYQVTITLRVLELEETIPLSLLEL